MLLGKFSYYYDGKSIIQVLDSVYSNIATAKYKAIRQRSFKTRLELFLFDATLRGATNQFEVTEFLSFRPSDQLIARLEEAWQKDEIQVDGNIFSTKTIDTIILNWLASNRAMSDNWLLSYHEYFELSVLSFEQFKQVFPEDSRKRICHYTGLSDFDFEQLRKRAGIKTKNARGRYMEIDRLNSNKEYSADNIVLCCYWANNAKTDEFTYPEFLQYVGPAMEKVFRERIKAG